MQQHLSQGAWRRNAHLQQRLPGGKWGSSAGIPYLPGRQGGAAALPSPGRGFTLLRIITPISIIHPVSSLFSEKDDDSASACLWRRFGRPSSDLYRSRALAHPHFLRLKSMSSAYSGTLIPHQVRMGHAMLFSSVFLPEDLMCRASRFLVPRRETASFFFCSRCRG